MRFLTCLIALSLLFALHEASSSRRVKKTKPLRKRKRVAARKTKSKLRSVATSSKKEDSKATSSPLASLLKESATSTTAPGKVIDPDWEDFLALTRYTGIGRTIRVGLEDADETDVSATITPSTASTPEELAASDEFVSKLVNWNMYDSLDSSVFNEAFQVAERVLESTSAKK